VSRAPRAASARRDWGDEEDGCAVLHVDMDAFFASVELARRPELRGLPVIVGGRSRGVVLSATYEARAFGVRSAMPMARALGLCPQAVVVPPDHTAYRTVSRSVMQAFRDVTPIVEPVSVDEAFLDVSGARRRLGAPTRIGAALRERVQAEHGITCSVGVASTKLVAKLASTHAKPDGMMLVPAAASVDFLRSLPVGALWGVGERTEEQLARRGIRTVAELGDADVAWLRSFLGPSLGGHLHDLAWGRDHRSVTPQHEDKSIGNETTFPQDVRDPGVVAATVLELADRCAARLRAQGLVARVVTVKVRTSDFRTVTRARTLVSPTDTGQEIAAIARELVAATDLRGLAVRLVGVRTEQLEERGRAAVQLTLDDATTEAPEVVRAAEEALDAVRARFGAASVRRASAVTRSTTTRTGGELSSE